MVFCLEKCSHLLFEKCYCDQEKFLDPIRTTYSNIERSEQFLKQNNKLRI